MPKPIEKQQRLLNRIGAGILLVFILAVPSGLLLLMSPTLYGSVRRGVAWIAVALGLITLNVIGRRIPFSGMSPLINSVSGRLFIATTMGALLGLLWGLVAGGASLWMSAASGVQYAVTVWIAHELGTAYKRRRHVARSPDGSA